MNDIKTFFSGPSEFSIYIETQAIESGESVLDTLLEYMAETGVDAQRIKHLLSPPLIEKLRADFVERGMLKGESATLDKFL